MNTNIISVLENAQKTGSKGSYNVLNKIKGSIISDLNVRYGSDCDYLIFDNSNENISADFTLKYSAVEFQVAINPKTSKNALHIKINCLLRSKLSQFYEDLCLNFDSSNTDESVWNVIEDYADLFKKVKSGLLSNEEEIGLVGELVVFLQIFENGHSNNVLKYWKGPLNSLHDYVNENNWHMEVKTSLNPNPVVKVHPIQQLEPISLSFNLILVKLLRDRKAGSTLSQFVDVIMTKLTSNKEKKEFESLLLSVGYKEVHKSRYTRMFTIDEILRYKIDKSTTTLCPATIGSKARYLDIRWTLQASDYPMINCDPAFWKNPAI